MIDNTTKYLKEILDANAVLSLPGNYELSNLPNYLRDVYEYRKVNLFNREIYFIFRKNAEPLTAYQYKKQINLIQEKLTEVTATVWRENLVRIDGMFYITKVPSLPELKVGTKVLLEIKHIDTLLMELNCKFKQVMETEVAEMVEVEDAEI